MPIVTVGSARRPRRAYNYAPGGGSSRYATLQALGSPTFHVGNACATQADINNWGFTDTDQCAYDAVKQALKIKFSGNQQAPDAYHMLQGNRRSLEIDITSGKVLLSWDLWYDPTLKHRDMGGNRNLTSYNWKGNLQIRRDNDSLWQQTSTRFYQDTPTQYVGEYDLRANNSIASINGATTQQPFSPFGTGAAARPIYLPHGQWIRFVVQLELNKTEADFPNWPSVLAAGKYLKYSAWLHNGAWVTCYDGVPTSPWTPYGTPLVSSVDKVQLEFATSSEHLESTGIIRFTGTPGSTVAKSLKVYTLDGLKRFNTVSTNLTSGTAQSGSTSTTLKLAASANLADDYLRGATVTITSGTGSGQTRVAAGNVQATDVVTVTVPWTTTPDNTSGYAVAGPWTIDGTGTVDVPSKSCTLVGTPQTYGYPSNINNGTAFQFSPDSTPGGLDSASTAVSAFTGGLDIYEADAFCWVKDVIVLRDYGLPGTPLNDSLIFEVP